MDEFFHELIEMIVIMSILFLSNFIKKFNLIVGEMIIKKING